MQIVLLGRARIAEVKKAGVFSLQFGGVFGSFYAE